MGSPQGRAPRLPAESVFHRVVLEEGSVLPEKTMYCRIVFCSVFLLTLVACAVKAPPPVEFTAPVQKIDYVDEVRPILKKRCVVCHSCYNSPCQLKLSSYEGLQRGGSRTAVYNALRRTTMEPTRLFVDAQTTEQWRQKGFYSVTDSTTTCGGNNSTMLQLLAHKNDHPMQSGERYFAESSDLICADSDKRLGQYFKKHPNGGMPFGFPPLTSQEYQTIAGWLVQGAEGPNPSQLSLEEAIPAADADKIRIWERFFNGDASKQRMTARYLYEHLFLAHIFFDTGSGVYYELVRSRTGPGSPIDIIATTLPYEDPGKDVDRVYYRFRKITSIIVHKTHITFKLSDDAYNRYQKLFIDSQWLHEPVRLKGYTDIDNANPFAVFEQIPPSSRYRFLLDNIHYIIMTFIRGPVCKGQVALNVVRDHFWLLFLDPEYDITVNRPGFLHANLGLLEMPLMEADSWHLFESTLKRSYRKKSSRFTAVRQRAYDITYRYRELDHRAIWAGSEPGDTPLLTVFRHFDSASVHAGALGPLPRTLWVMDYPLIERIYYSLVAGFNVFGPRFHQLAIRVYMDELRQEGETYFLDFMPKSRREPMMRDWYGSMDITTKKIDYSMSELEAGFVFSSEESDPKREFLEYLVNNHFLKTLGITFDENYRYQDEPPAVMPENYETFDNYVQAFKATAQNSTSFYTTVKSHNANLAYIRIMVDDDEANDIYLSMLINRWHDDVTTLYGEEDRLRPEKDTGVFLRRFVGSYPNYFFEISKEDIPDFLHLLATFNASAEHVEALNRWGVNRMQSNFWEVYDRFQKRFDESEEIDGGLFDLNRYYNLALEDRN